MKKTLIKKINGTEFTIPKIIAKSKRKMLFAEQDIKVEDCEKPSVRQTQPSVKFDSTNKCLIFDLLLWTS
jgi:hypothetical protein